MHRSAHRLALTLLLAGCGADESPAAREPAPAEPSPPAEEAPEDEPRAEEETEPAPTEPPERPPADAQARFARANNAVATDLYAQLRGAPGNLIVSPASVTLALAMTYGGAAGETAAEMRTALHFDAFETRDALHAAAGGLLATWNAPRESYELAVVNRLFGQQGYPFVPAFSELTETRYAAPTESVDFRDDTEAARVRINEWVSEQTRTRIPELFAPGILDATTRLVLTNAVYFLGSWSTPFPESGTRPAPFSVGDARPEVPTMHLTSRLRYAETEAAQVVQLPYEGGELAMLLVVPRAENGLAAVEAGLDPDAIEGWVNGLSPRQVALAMPKARIAPDAVVLTGALEAMGIRRAFRRDQADFSDMSRPEDPDETLHIAAVVHRAFVEIDEQGTEAAAATGVVMASRAGAPAPPTEVRADRPFLFLIRDLTSGAILFVGRVTDPR